MTKILLVILLQMLIFNLWEVSAIRRRKSLTHNNCEICGASDERKIVNGDVMQNSTQYPWIVLLLNNNDRCTGAVISSNFILTAAHCVYKKVYADDQENGEETSYRLRKPSEFTVKLITDIESYHNVSKVIAHRIYPSKSPFVLGMHDIALLKLREHLTCDSQYPAPICVHHPAMEEASGDISVAGFGLPNENQEEEPTLREGVMTTSIDAKKCQLKDFRYNMCFLGVKSNQTACSGDSGSSAFKKFGDSWYTVGVSSRRRSIRCSQLEPSYFTKIAPHFEWIKKHVENLPTPHRVSNE